MFVNNSNNSETIISANQTPNGLPTFISNKIEEDDDEIDLLELWGTIKRRSLIIFGTAITLTGVLATWILAMPPVYEGRLKLRVEPDQSSSQNLTMLSNLLGSNNIPTSASNFDYASEIEMLKSPLVMTPIIGEIQSSYPQITQEDIMDDLTLQQLGTTKFLEIIYRSQSESEILFVLNEVINGYLDYQLNGQISNLHQVKIFTDEQIEKFRQDVLGLETQLEQFQQTNNLIDPTSQKSILSRKAETISQELANIQVELRGMIKLATELANQLNLTPEQGVLVARLHREENYRRLIANLNEVDGEIAVESLRFGMDHPMVKTLEEKRNVFVSLLNQETYKILGDRAINVPLQFLTSIPNNVEVSQRFFDTNNQIQVLEAKENELKKIEQQINQEINNSSTISKEFYQIQRELEIANESLVSLLGSNQQLEIEIARESNNWQLVTPINESVIEDVSGVTRKITLVAIASLFVGTGLGFMVDKLDSSIHSVDDLKNLVKLPCLGIIPHTKNLPSVGKKHQNKSYSKKSNPIHFDFNKGKLYKKNTLINFQEVENIDAYCSLYTNINLLSSDRSIRSVVIAAADAGEGKSTTSVLLARAASMLGKKVLLVDVDLRKPMVHEYLGLRNKTGLTNFITDNISLDQIIQKSEHEKLYIISAGSKPPSPTRIISSQKMKSLMAKLQKDFDLVIYDTPPLMGFSDAKIITPFSDGLVFVVGLGNTHRGRVEQTINDLQMSNLSILGIVANGVKKENDSSNYTKYYNNYGD